jgi:hypothetical protein
MTTDSPARLADVNRTALPESSVPAAFDRGHLYSPTADVTRYTLDDRYSYDYRPGNDFEPMPDAPRGDGKAFAWWWRNVASIDAPDFLGLRAGDEITIQHVTSTGPGVVTATRRSGAVVRYPLPRGGDRTHAEMYVRRRNTAGHWYP